jgi:hypothetical protein
MWSPLATTIEPCLIENVDNPMTTHWWPLGIQHIEVIGFDPELQMLDDKTIHLGMLVANVWHMLEGQIAIWKLKLIFDKFGIRCTSCSCKQFCKIPVIMSATIH